MSFTSPTRYCAEVENYSYQLIVEETTGHLAKMCPDLNLAQHTTTSKEAVVEDETSKLPNDHRKWKQVVENGTKAALLLCRLRRRSHRLRNRFSSNNRSSSRCSSRSSNVRSRNFNKISTFTNIKLNQREEDQQQQHQQ